MQNSLVSARSHLVFFTVQVSQLKEGLFRRRGRSTWQRVGYSWIGMLLASSIVAAVAVIPGTVGSISGNAIGCFSAWDSRRARLIGLMCVHGADGVPRCSLAGERERLGAVMERWELIGEGGGARHCTVNKSKVYTGTNKIHEFECARCLVRLCHTELGPTRAFSHQLFRLPFIRPQGHTC